MFKINDKDSDEKSAKEVEDVVDQGSAINDESGKPEKIENCYFCLQEFDMNKDDYSHYKYGKFPMCDYCSQFYGFYDETKIGKK